MSNLAFSSFTLIGVEALKFLQGQVTVNAEAMAENVSQYTAICDLKGRIHFGLWLKKRNPEEFEIVTTQDQAEEFAKHIDGFSIGSNDLTQLTLGLDRDYIQNVIHVFTSFHISIRVFKTTLRR